MAKRGSASRSQNPLGFILIVDIPKRVMEDLSALLGRDRGVSDDVDNRDVLAVRAANSTEGAQLSRAEGCHQRTRSLDAGIAISCICADKLIGGADPREPLGLDLVEQGEFIVARDAEDGVDTNLLETAKEVFTDKDFGHYVSEACGDGRDGAVWYLGLGTSGCLPGILGEA